jgi:hypothetical protein
VGRGGSEMAKRKVVTPSHRTVLQRGIQTAGDYMRLAQTLIWDVSNKLVPDSGQPPENN